MGRLSWLREGVGASCFSSGIRLLGNRELINCLTLYCGVDVVIEDVMFGQRIGRAAGTGTMTWSLSSISSRCLLVDRGVDFRLVDRRSSLIRNCRKANWLASPVSCNSVRREGVTLSLTGPEEQPWRSEASLP